MKEELREVMNIDGKEFFLVDVIDKYHYFAEINKPDSLCILKEQLENGEEYLVNLREVEVDKALLLFNKKYGDANK